MMKTTSIHQESIDFISNNINVPTAEIPKQLLEYWHTPKEITNSSKQVSNLNSFLVFQHALEIYGKTLGKEMQYSPLEEIGLFELFQLIIRVTLKKEKAVKINPIDLFDFDNYPKLNITIL